MGKMKVLFAAYIAFVIYGTLVPFHVVDSFPALLCNVESIRWLPFWDLHRGRIASIPDMVQNILLFLPIGILGAHCFGRRPGPTLATGFGLSLLVETLQLLTSNRVSSVNDLVFNTLGTLAGFLLYLRLAPAWSRLIHHPVMRDFARVPGALPLLLMMIYSWVYALEPFNFTLDVGAVWWNVRMFFGQLAHPRLVLRDEFILASQFALVGFLAAGLLHRLGARAAYPLSLLLVVLWATVTEMSQLIVASRVASALTLAFSWIGAGIGVAARGWYALSPRPGRFFAGYALFVLGAFAVDSLSPFVLRESYLRPALLPFRLYQSAYFVSALSNVFHALLVFMPLGYLASRIRLNRARGLLFWTVLLIASVAIELGQGFIAGRYPDVTDCFLPFAGAVIGWWLAGRVRRHGVVIRESAA
ncbi:MAG: VanZ family protein [Acidobacteriota bacterium]|jgi:glycopeptide antibiotics resistance protein|nr:VanZ family protein [Acidobacteriota bacterium]